MRVPITVAVDEEAYKVYSSIRATGANMSKLVSDYLKSLDDSDSEQKKEPEDDHHTEEHINQP